MHAYVNFNLINLILFAAYKYIINIQTQVSSRKGLEGNRKTIEASQPNLKLDYIIKKLEKEIVRKSNTYKYFTSFRLYKGSWELP